MKDYRLDNLDWYDQKLDKVQCIECGEWFNSIEWFHTVKVHGISIKDYKKKHGILPKTPLRRKSALLKGSDRMKKMREKGIAKVFKKGETSIPVSYQKSKTKHKLYEWAKGESSELIRQSKEGVPLSPEHIAKIKERMQDPKYYAHLKEHNFKKGQVPNNKRQDHCDIIGCKRPHLSLGFCHMHYQRLKSLFTKN